MTNFDYFDEQLFDMAHRIERFGFTTMAVNTGECSVPGCSSPEHPGPAWTYSIGMLEDEHPEIVIGGCAARSRLRTHRRRLRVASRRPVVAIRS